MVHGTDYSPSVHSSVPAEPRVYLISGRIDGSAVTSHTYPVSSAEGGVRPGAAGSSSLSSTTAPLDGANPSDDPTGRMAQASRLYGMKVDAEGYAASELESPQHLPAALQSPRSCATDGQERGSSSPSWVQPSATAPPSPPGPRSRTSEGLERPTASAATTASGGRGDTAAGSGVGAGDRMPHDSNGWSAVEMGEAKFASIRSYRDEQPEHYKAERASLNSVADKAADDAKLDARYSNDLRVAVAASHRTCRASAASSALTDDAAPWNAPRVAAPATRTASTCGTLGEGNSPDGGGVSLPSRAASGSPAAEGVDGGSSASSPCSTDGVSSALAAAAPEPALGVDGDVSRASPNAHPTSASASSARPQVVGRFSSGVESSVVETAASKCAVGATASAVAVLAGPPTSCSDGDGRCGGCRLGADLSSSCSSEAFQTSSSLCDDGATLRVCSAGSNSVHTTLPVSPGLTSSSTPSCVTEEPNVLASPGDATIHDQNTRETLPKFSAGAGSEDGELRVCAGAAAVGDMGAALAPRAASTPEARGEKGGVGSGDESASRTPVPSYAQIAARSSCAKTVDAESHLPSQLPSSGPPGEFDSTSGFSGKATAADVKAQAGASSTGTSPPPLRSQGHDVDQSLEEMLLELPQDGDLQVRVQDVPNTGTLRRVQTAHGLREASCHVLLTTGQEITVQPTKVELVAPAQAPSTGTADVLLNRRTGCEFNTGDGLFVPLRLYGLTIVGNSREYHVDALYNVGDTGGGTSILGSSLGEQFRRRDPSTMQRPERTESSVRRIRGLSSVDGVTEHVKLTLNFGGVHLTAGDVPLLAGYDGLLLGNEFNFHGRANFDFGARIIGGREYDGVLTMRDAQGVASRPLPFDVRCKLPHPSAQVALVAPAEQVAGSAPACSFCGNTLLESLVTGVSTGKHFCNHPLTAYKGRSCAMVHLQHRDELLKLTAGAARSSDGDSEVYLRCYETYSNDVARLWLHADGDCCTLYSSGCKPAEAVPLVTKEGTLHSSFVSPRTDGLSTVKRDFISGLETAWSLSALDEGSAEMAPERLKALTSARMLSRYGSVYQYAQTMSAFTALETATVQKSVERFNAQGVHVSWGASMGDKLTGHFRLPSVTIERLPASTDVLIVAAAESVDWRATFEVRVVTEGGEVMVFSMTDCSKHPPEDGLHSLYFSASAVPQLREQAGIRRLLDDTTACDPLIGNILLGDVGAPHPPGSAKTKLVRPMQAKMKTPNASQLQSMLVALTQKVTILVGPPGTGKTQVITLLVYNLTLQQKDRVLVCAQTNRAANQIAELLKLASCKTYRLRSQSAQESETESAVASRLLRLRAQHGELSSEDAAALEAEFRPPEMADLLDSEVIVTTCAAAGSNLLTQLRFGALVIEEATQVTEPSLLVPLTLGTRQLVLVGDVQQLGPFVASDVAKRGGLGRSLFQRLLELGHPKQMLTEQYRMHPRLAEFPSKYFYEGKLQTADSVIQRSRHTRLGPSFPWPLVQEGYDALSVLGAREPLVFFQVDGLQTQVGTSIANEHEARAAVRAIALLRQDGVATSAITVLTPYAAQVAALNKVLQQQLVGSPTQVAVSTIDKYQGQEQEYVILSCVASGRNASGHVTRGQRVNVSLTRARLGLIVLGNAQSLSHGEVWRAYCGYLKERHLLVSEEQLWADDAWPSPPPSPPASPPPHGCHADTLVSSGAEATSPPASPTLAPAPAVMAREQLAVADVMQFSGLAGSMATLWDAVADAAAGALNAASVWMSSLTTAKSAAVSTAAAELKLVATGSPLLEEIIKAQRTDDVLRAYAEYIAEGEASSRFTSLCRKERRAFLNDVSNMRFDQRGVLVYCRPARGSPPVAGLVVLPLCLRQRVFAEFHDCMGHPGASRVERLVLSRYWWGSVDEMRASLRRYVAACHHCRADSLLSAGGKKGGAAVSPPKRKSAPSPPPSPQTASNGKGPVTPQYWYVLVPADDSEPLLVCLTSAEQLVKDYDMTAFSPIAFMRNEAEARRVHVTMTAARVATRLRSHVTALTEAEKAAAEIRVAVNAKLNMSPSVQASQAGPSGENYAESRTLSRKQLGTPEQGKALAEAERAVATMHPTAGDTIRRLAHTIGVPADSRVPEIVVLNIAEALESHLGVASDRLTVHAIRRSTRASLQTTATDVQAWCHIFDTVRRGRSIAVRSAWRAFASCYSQLLALLSWQRMMRSQYTWTHLAGSLRRRREPTWVRRLCLVRWQHMANGLQQARESLTATLVRESRLYRLIDYKYMIRTLLLVDLPPPPPSPPASPPPPLHAQSAEHGRLDAFAQGLRQAPDGGWYSQVEFFDFFGSLTEWFAAASAPDHGDGVLASIDEDYACVSNAAGGDCMVYALDQALTSSTESDSARMNELRRQIADEMRVQSNHWFGDIKLCHQVMLDVDDLRKRGFKGILFSEYLTWIRMNGVYLGANELRVAASLKKRHIVVVRKERGVWTLMDMYGDESHAQILLKHSGSNLQEHFEWLRPVSLTHGVTETSVVQSSPDAPLTSSSPLIPSAVEPVPDAGSEQSTVICLYDGGLSHVFGAVRLGAHATFASETKRPQSRTWLMHNMALVDWPQGADSYKVLSLLCSHGIRGCVALLQPNLSELDEVLQNEEFVGASHCYRQETPFAIVAIGKAGRRLEAAALAVGSCCQRLHPCDVDCSLACDVQHFVWWHGVGMPPLPFAAVANRGHPSATLSRADRCALLGYPTHMISSLKDLGGIVSPAVSAFIISHLLGREFDTQARSALPTRRGVEYLSAPTAAAASPTASAPAAAPAPSAAGDDPASVPIVTHLLQVRVRTAEEWREYTQVPAPKWSSQIEDYSLSRRVASLPVAKQPFLEAPSEIPGFDQGPRDANLQSGAAVFLLAYRDRVLGYTVDTRTGFLFAAGCQAVLSHAVRAQKYESDLREYKNSPSRPDKREPRPPQAPDAHSLTHAATVALAGLLGGRAARNAVLAKVRKVVQEWPLGHSQHRQGARLPNAISIRTTRDMQGSAGWTRQHQYIWVIRLPDHIDFTLTSTEATSQAGIVFWPITGWLDGARRLPACSLIGPLAVGESGIRLHRLVHPVTGDYDLTSAEEAVGATEVPLCTIQPVTVPSYPRLAFVSWTLPDLLGHLVHTRRSSFAEAVELAYVESGASQNNELPDEGEREATVSRNDIVGALTRAMPSSQAAGGHEAGVERPWMSLGCEWSYYRQMERRHKTWESRMYLGEYRTVTGGWLLRLDSYNGVVTHSDWSEVGAVRRFDNFIDALHELREGLAPDILNVNVSEEYILRGFHALYAQQHPDYYAWLRSFKPGAGSVVCWQLLPYSGPLPIADVKTVRIVPPAYSVARETRYTRERALAPEVSAPESTPHECVQGSQGRSALELAIADGSLSWEDDRTDRGRQRPTWQLYSAMVLSHVPGDSSWRMGSCLRVLGQRQRRKPGFGKDEVFFVARPASPDELPMAQNKRRFHTELLRGAYEVERRPWWTPSNHFLTSKRHFLTTSQARASARHATRARLVARHDKQRRGEKGGESPEESNNSLTRMALLQEADEVVASVNLLFTSKELSKRLAHARQRTRDDVKAHDELGMSSKPPHVLCLICGAVSRVEHNFTCSVCCAAAVVLLAYPQRALLEKACADAPCVRDKTPTRFISASKVWFAVRLPHGEPDDCISLFAHVRADSAANRPQFDTLGGKREPEDKTAGQCGLREVAEEAQLPSRWTAAMRDALQLAPGETAVVKRQAASVTELHHVHLWVVWLTPATAAEWQQVEYTLEGRQEALNGSGAWFKAKDVINNIAGFRTLAPIADALAGLLEAPSQERVGEWQLRGSCEPPPAPSEIRRTYEPKLGFKYRRCGSSVTTPFAVKIQRAWKRFTVRDAPFSVVRTTRQCL